MATKTFRAFLVDQGREGILTDRDPRAIATASAEYAEYLRDESAKDNPAIAYTRQANKLREVARVVGDLVAQSDAKQVPATRPITWAEVKLLRQQVNGLRRALGLNEEVEALPADTPPA